MRYLNQKLSLFCNWGRQQSRQQLKSQLDQISRDELNLSIKICTLTSTLKFLMSVPKILYSTFWNRYLPSLFPPRKSNRTKNIMLFSFHFSDLNRLKHLVSFFKDSTRLCHPSVHRRDGYYFSLLKGSTHLKSK